MTRKPAAPKRERHQLVVALGAGHTGYRRKLLLSEAAARAKKPSLSAWVLGLLMKEAGEPLTEPAPSRQEFDELRMRVTELEARGRA